MFSFSYDTQQTRNVFSEARFLYMDERIKQTWQPLITRTGRATKKIVLKQREACLKPGNIIYSYLSPSAQEKTLLTQSRSFFAGTSHSLLLDTIETSASSFFISLFFNIETQLKQRILQNTEKLLYCRHCSSNL